MRITNDEPRTPSVMVDLLTALATGGWGVAVRVDDVDDFLIGDIVAVDDRGLRFTVADEEGNHHTHDIRSLAEVRIE